MKNKAFTLIELLVVIAIIGILATVVIASLNSARSKARDARRISDIRNVQTALEMYYADNGLYPPNGLTTGCANNVWETPLNPLLTGGYLSSLPKDPTNSGSYCYHYASSYPTESSSWVCGSEVRSDFAYSIFFSLENSSSFGLTSSNNTFPVFNKCVVGFKK